MVRHAKEALLLLLNAAPYTHAAPRPDKQIQAVSSAISVDSGGLISNVVCLALNLVNGLLFQTTVCPAPGAPPSTKTTKSGPSSTSILLNPTDLLYLKASATEFCSSFISYTPSSVITQTTSTPTEPVTVVDTTVVVVSVTVATATSDIHWKRMRRQDLQPSFPKYDFRPTEAAHINHAAAVHDLPEAAPSHRDEPQILGKRAVPVPALIKNWPASVISQLCSQIATGVTTVTSTTVLPSSTTTSSSTSTSTALSAGCVVPSLLPDYATFTPIWGVWDVDKPGPNPGPIGSGLSTIIQAPFPVCMFGRCTTSLQVSVGGEISFSGISDSIKLGVFSGRGLYIYLGWYDGVFTRVTGETGSRQFVISWYASTERWGHENTHVTLTYFEDKPNNIVYKYYDAIQSLDSRPLPQAFVQLGTAKTLAWPSGTLFVPGTEIRVLASPDGTTTVSTTSHDRVDCCTKNTWHSCTEFQPAKWYY